MQTLPKELEVNPEEQKSTYFLRTVIRNHEMVYASQGDINISAVPYRVMDGNIPKELGNGKEKRGTQFKAVQDWIREPGQKPLRALRGIEVVKYAYFRN